MSRRRRPSRRSRFSDPSGGEPRLDLHMHSTRSDGELSPDEVLATCARRGLSIVALTDHDAPPALTAGMHTVGDRTLRVLEAAEVSGTHEGGELHLLVYFNGPMPSLFRAFLTARSKARAARYEHARLSMGLAGVAPADDDAVAGRRALTRHHLARALVAAGHASSVHHAFASWCGRKHGHVPPEDLTFRQAIEAARAAGGVPVWAHPRHADAELWLSTFKSWGLQGVETNRPSLSGPATAALSRLARQHLLVETGGSDFHGWGARPLGSFRYRHAEARDFLDLLAEAPSDASCPLAG